MSATQTTSHYFLFPNTLQNYYFNRSKINFNDIKVIVKNVHKPNVKVFFD